MSRTRPVRLAMLAPAVALLGACGGGGGGGGGGDDDPPPVEGIPVAPSTALPLSNRNHVLREVGNTIEVYAAFFNLDPGSLAAPAARATPVRPKAAVTAPCEAGGFRTSDEGSAARTFEHFAVSATVAFTTELNAGCAEGVPGEQGVVVTVDGDFEQGDTALDEQGDAYAYERYGGADARYAERRRDEAAPGDLDYRDEQGLTEFRLSPTRTEARSVRASRYERRTGAQYAAGDRVQGADGDPFVTAFDAADGTLRFDGPYRYATRVCAGGQARVATVEPVTLDGQSVPNGGRLEFTSGSARVEVSFNLDGTATFQFAGGGSGTLTRDEIVASPAAC